MASPIVKGNTFGATDTVTSTTLNNIVDNSTFKGTDGNGVAFSASSGGDLGACVAAGGLEVHSTGQLQIKDNGVTLAKMATQADQTVLGNVSGGTAVPTAVPIVGAAGILVNNDSLGTDDTKGATQGNIKAYVDSHGITQSSGSAPYFGCRAFGAFNGQASTPITPESSGNIASIVRNSTGSYTITFTTAMPSTNYTVVANENHATSSSFGTSTTVSSRNTTSFILRTGEANTGANFNPDYIGFSVFA